VEPPVKRRKPRRSASVKAVAVKPSELRALRAELERRMQPRVPPGSRRTGRTARRTHRRDRSTPLRWNPDPEDVQRSVAQLVLTIVEFLRKLMERQAIRRMEQKTLTRKEVEAVGLALMRLEKTVRDIGKRFGIPPEDLNLDLGPIKLI
jgi:hypothetical protein